MSPDLQRDILQLVDRHGAEAVFLGVNQMIEQVRRSGRPEANDWAALASFFDQDAVDWIAGRDPFRLRSNNAIAIAFADANPGQSRDSTARRIRRKLADKTRGRRWRMLVRAAAMSKRAHPYDVYGRAIIELDRIEDDNEGQTWWRERSHLQSMIARYRKSIGDAPAASMSFEDIEGAIRRLDDHGRNSPSVSSG